MTSYPSIPIAGGDTATPLNGQKRIAWMAPLLKEGASLLDCGCGRGEYVKMIRKEFGVNAVGIEYLAEKVCKAQQDPAIAEYIQQGNIENIPFPNASFDIALLNEVLEHVPNEDRAMAEIHRVLKKDAILVIFSPNRWYPFETHGTHLKNTQIRIPHWVPGIPWLPLKLGHLVLDYWARNYWPHELANIVTRHGFKVLQRSYVWQTFENISGRQPVCIRMLAPWLRSVFNFCEKVPLLNRLGVSQVLVLRKIDTPCPSR
jgi:ubiquinone/menaquinone biosynthesis C-methylase UbiE